MFLNTFIISLTLHLWSSRLDYSKRTKLDVELYALLGTLEPNICESDLCCNINITNKVMGITSTGRRLQTTTRKKFIKDICSNSPNYNIGVYIYCILGRSINLVVVSKIPLSLDKKYQRVLAAVSTASSRAPDYLTLTQMQWSNWKDRNCCRLYQNYSCNLFIRRSPSGNALDEIVRKESV